MSDQEREAYLTHLDNIAYQNDVLATYHEEGREEGLAEGREEGREAERREMILSMHAFGMAAEQIAAIAKISLDKIREIISSKN